MIKFLKQQFAIRQPGTRSALRYRIWCGLTVAIVLIAPSSFHTGVCPAKPVLGEGRRAADGIKVLNETMLVKPADRFYWKLPLCSYCAIRSQPADQAAGTVKRVA